MLKTCAVVPAAGRGVRMGKGKPKQFLELLGKPILCHTVEALCGGGFLAEVIVVVPEGFAQETEQMLDQHGFRSARGRRGLDSSKGLALPGNSTEESLRGEVQRGSSGSPETGAPRFSVVAGGVERKDSVFNALECLPAHCEYVLIHDGVRPFVTPRLLEATWKAALESGAAIAAVPSTDTVKRVQDGKIAETLAREAVWLIQTPQVFRKAVLMDAYRQARENGWSGTDDAALVERIGHPVTVVMGERSNIKVTTPEDLTWAEWFLAPGGERVKARRNESGSSAVRVGFGYDVHGFVSGRPLVLGGVEIPFERGLLGHSDADVLLHAVCDALLGAAALGDIGRHFPDTDPAFKGISSLILLERTAQIVSRSGFSIHNIDATLVLQKPRLAPYIPRMIEEISRVTGLPATHVNVKATTTEKLGFTGREEGVAAYAAVILEEGPS